MLTDIDVRPSYFFSFNPALEGYRPKWLDNLAEDAALEGSMLDGVVVGAENVRSIVTTIRSLYDRQSHRFADHVGGGYFLEDYVAEIRGEPLGCVVIVSYNEAGQANRIVASYRPRTAVMHFARILADEFAGTPIAHHFGGSTRQP